MGLINFGIMAIHRRSDNYKIMYFHVFCGFQTMREFLILCGNIGEYERINSKSFPYLFWIIIGRDTLGLILILVDVNSLDQLEFILFLV
jgi:hypothetical protein